MKSTTFPPEIECNTGKIIVLVSFDEVTLYILILSSNETEVNTQEISQKIVMIYVLFLKEPDGKSPMKVLLIVSLQPKANFYFKFTRKILESQE